jgi:hypothetical protein
VVQAVLYFIPLEPTVVKEVRRQQAALRLVQTDLQLEAVAQQAHTTQQPLQYQVAVAWAEH